MRYPEETGWRWWAKVGAILVAAVLATGLIVFGALRFLDQAQREHDRVECIRVQVQHQASGNAAMAAAVLDPERTPEQRTAAVAAWRDDQARSADAIGRC